MSRLIRVTDDVYRGLQLAGVPFDDMQEVVRRLTDGNIEPFAQPTLRSRASAGRVPLPPIGTQLESIPYKGARYHAERVQEGLKLLDGPAVGTVFSSYSSAANATVKPLGGGQTNGVLFWQAETHRPEGG